MNKSTYLILICWALLAFTLHAQDTLIISKSKDFIIDGYGNNPAWQGLEWIDLTQSVNLEPEELTRVKICYSESGIYFLFDCQDDRITATLLRDFSDLWTEDVVEVFLWPDTNFTVYFEYELSPKNIELPIIVPNRDGEFLGWRPWKYVGDRKVIHETSVQMKTTAEGAEIQGWTAEFFIPFKLLNPLVTEPIENGDVWRINMYRFDHDLATPTRWFWQPIEKRFHEFRKFGYAIFE